MERTTYDKKVLYCRRLGHLVPFGYCRKEHHFALELPCLRIMDCWQETMAIENFILEFFTSAERAHLYRSARAKIDTIIELIEHARDRHILEKKPS